MPGQVMGAWLHTRVTQTGGRVVIAVDGKAVRSARNREEKAPHLVAALAHGIGAVLGQVAVDAKSNEIPTVRELLIRTGNAARVMASLRSLAISALCLDGHANIAATTPATRSDAKAASNCMSGFAVSLAAGLPR